jgi:anti-anti-sigma factor
MKDKPGFFTVIPVGSIDSDTHSEFREQIKSLLVPTTKGIVLDFNNVDYISSAGLGVLFGMKKFLTEHKGELLFCNLKPQIKRLFEVVNALPKETLFKSVEEADAYLYKMMNKKLDEE